MNNYENIALLLSSKASLMSAVAKIESDIELIKYRSMAKKSLNQEDSTEKVIKECREQLDAILEKLKARNTS